jgi:transcriptional regulator of met regulon
MAKKSIKILIDDVETDVVIRRAKKKDVKEITLAIASKVDEVVKELATSINIEKLVSDNLDFICEQVIIPFTNLTAEQMDNMDIVDIVALVKDLLDYNSVDFEKIIKFIKNLLTPDTAMKQQIAQKLNFGGVEVPSSN